MTFISGFQNRAPSSRLKTPPRPVPLEGVGPMPPSAHAWSPGSSVLRAKGFVAARAQQPGAQQRHGRVAKPQPNDPCRARLACDAGMLTVEFVLSEESREPLLPDRQVSLGGPLPQGQRERVCGELRTALRGPRRPRPQGRQPASAPVRVPPSGPGLIFHSAASRPSCKPNLTWAH